MLLELAEGEGREDVQLLADRIDRADKGCRSALGQRLSVRCDTHPQRADELGVAVLQRCQAGDRQVDRAQEGAEIGGVARRREEQQRPPPRQHVRQHCLGAWHKAVLWLGRGHFTVKVCEPDEKPQLGGRHTVALRLEARRGGRRDRDGLVARVRQDLGGVGEDTLAVERVPDVLGDGSVGAGRVGLDGDDVRWPDRVQDSLEEEEAEAWRGSAAPAHKKNTCNPADRVHDERDAVDEVARPVAVREVPDTLEVQLCALVDGH